MSGNGCNLYACLRAGKKSISAGCTVENLSSITIPNNIGDAVRHRVTADHCEADLAHARFRRVGESLVHANVVILFAP